MSTCALILESKNYVSQARLISSWPKISGPETTGSSGSGSFGFGVASKASEREAQSDQPGLGAWLCLSIGKRGPGFRFRAFGS